MVIHVEFTGAAQMVTNQKSVDLEIPSTTTYKEIVQILGKKYPSLIGILIDQDGETLLSSNMFIINGDMSLPAMIMEESPRDGDRLILMSLITGG